MLEGAPKISGTPIQNYRKVMTEVVGADLLARALAKLPGEVAREFEGATALSWVPVDWFNEVLFAVASEAGRMPLDLHAEVLRVATERTFSTVWRLLLRFTTAELMVKRAPAIYSRSYAQGELTARVVGAGKAEFELVGWPDVPDVQLRSIQIATGVGFRMQGFKDVKVVSERRAGGAYFLATWRS